MAMSPEQRAAWRARRAERRARQRAENVERARQMHKARLEYQKSHALSAAAATGNDAPRAAMRPQAFVGCSGWYYWHWRGTFYPEGLPTSGWFNHYASRFNTVE